MLVPPKKTEKKKIMKILFGRKRRKLYPLYRVMREIGKAHRLSIPQVAMCYVASKGIVPVCGCRKSYQVKELAEAVKVPLRADELEKLEKTADKTGVKILGADMFRFAVKKGDRETRYKELTIREFTKAADVYESGHAGIYEMCKDDYPFIAGEGQTLDFARRYLFWTVVIGGLPTVLNLVLANIIRAQGKAKIASIGMSVGGILNIILDPIFIFLLHMNVAGAALATCCCLSNTISMLYLLQHVVRNRQDSAVKLTFSPQKVSAVSIRDILSIGTPAALQILLASVSNSVMIQLMAGYADSAISGLGIAQKIEIIPFQVVQGISSGVLPLIAYNFASENRKRMNDTVLFSIRLGLVLSAAFFILIELGAPIIVRFFIADPETIAYGAAFTRLRCIALPFINIEFMLIAVFQGIGSARQALILSFFRKGILDLPLMIMANLVWPMYGLILVQPVMELSGSMIALGMYRKVKGNVS